MSDSTITIVGNAGKDPEVKFLQNGDAMVSVSIAVTPRVKKGDEWVDGQTTWYRCATFGAAGEAFAETCKKGDRLIATGEFAVYEYEKDGEKRSIPEIRRAVIGVVPKPKPKEKPREQASSEDDPWAPGF